MRNLKILGLALVAILAFSAVGAVGASADDLTAEKYPVLLTGGKDLVEEAPDQFVTTAGTVTCKEPKYEATISGPTTSVTATPTYAGCTTSGLPSTITMNGCTYKFSVEGGGSTAGKAELVCSGANEVTVTVAPTGSATHRCTIHVTPQLATGTIKYTNIGAGTTREITIDVSLEKLHYTHTAGTGLGACPSGTGNNGTLTAKAVITGENDPAPFKEHIGIFMS